MTKAHENARPGTDEALAALRHVDELMSRADDVFEAFYVGHNAFDHPDDPYLEVLLDGHPHDFYLDELTVTVMPQDGPTPRFQIHRLTRVDDEDPTTDDVVAEIIGIDELMTYLRALVLLIRHENGQTIPGRILDEPPVDVLLYLLNNSNPEPGTSWYAEHPDTAPADHADPAAGIRARLTLFRMTDAAATEANLLD